MGKLKFTFATTWYWLALILMNFLTENLAHTGANPKDGFNYGSLIIISVAVLGCLLLFYIIQHKDNKMKVDWVLLPSIIIVGICFLVGIWISKDFTVIGTDGREDVEVIHTLYDKIRASVILVLFLAFMYAMLFASRIHGMRSKTVQFLTLCGIVAALISLVFSLIAEIDQYKLIFSDVEIKHVVIDSFYGNKNYYGGVLFIGFLCCILGNYYRPRVSFYLLLIVFTLAIIACGAMLPSIISALALVIYLFEEIVRFSFKKRWLFSIVSLLSLLIVIAGIIIFYFGSSHGWKGFTGLDQYLSELFHSKNFKTLTGRTTIWKDILPYCFEDPISIIFGHGFMISEQSILGITKARFGMGVRTTHNGYLQIMFEYGLIGVVIHIILLGFFIYSCIRMMCEKKFHYAFIYLFIGLCCAVYNFCESSSFFDAGVKEIFMTQTFVMPIIVDAKFVGREKKRLEIKNLPVNDKPIDPLKLGRGISIFIMSLIVVCASTLLSSYTYQNEIFKKIMLISLGGLFICLIFLPYLISLWYRNTDKYNFILNIVFNILLIAASMAALYFFLTHTQTFKDVALIALPFALVIVLLLDTIIYALIKKSNFKEWADIFFKGSFVIPRNAIFGGILIGGVSYLTITMFGEMTVFIYLISLIFPIIGFYGVYHFFPTKGGKEVRDTFNTINLGIIQRIALKDEVYYG